MTTILVCEPDPAVRLALQRTLGMVAGVDRVETFADRESFLAHMVGTHVDVAVVPARLPQPGTPDTIRTVAVASPNTVLLVSVGHSEAEAAGRAIEAGGHGYIARDASVEEAGAVLGILLAEPRKTHVGAPGSRPPQLTEREQQVLERMARGMSNADIGADLFLSEDTVKTHARRLFAKLDASDRAAAVAQGFRWRLLR